MDARRTAALLVLGAVAATGTLTGCSRAELTPAVSTPTAGAQSPGWVSAKKAVSIAVDRYGGTLESVTQRPSKNEPAWQVALTGTDAGHNLVVMVAQQDGAILATRPL